MLQVRVLTEVSHPNIVPLLGSALDGPQPCLAYALMEGGALDERLARTAGRRALTASERVLILSDAARGLVRWGGSLSLSLSLSHCSLSLLSLSFWQKARLLSAPFCLSF